LARRVYRAGTVFHSLCQQPAPTSAVLRVSSSF